MESHAKHLDDTDTDLELWRHLLCCSWKTLDNTSSMFIVLAGGVTLGDATSSKISWVLFRATRAKGRRRLFTALGRRSTAVDIPGWRGGKPEGDYSALWWTCSRLLITLMDVWGLSRRTLNKNVSRARTRRSSSLLWPLLNMYDVGHTRLDTDHVRESVSRSKWTMAAL